jgi:hypothetical protein
MGLEMGPPWLVAVVSGGDRYEVIFRDNFTGAGFERVRKVVKDEPGAISAVLGKGGKLAKHQDGSLFQPIEEMKGRNSGTPADQGHSAYLMACELLGERPYIFASTASTQAWVAGSTKWNALAIGGLVFFFIVASFFG